MWVGWGREAERRRVRRPAAGEVQPIWRMLGWLAGRGGAHAGALAAGRLLADGELMAG